VTSSATAAVPKQRRSLSTRILIGLGSGVAVGLFIGERAAVFQIVADGYLRLLQMTVLPYVTLSIVTGLGSLNASQALTLGKRVGGVLLLLWGLALGAVFLFPLMFPAGESASFFSTTLIEQREPFDFLNLYIPANPFNSLANNVVPAVVLFSLFLGGALITVPEKSRLLGVLAVASAAVSKATNFVVALTPFGVAAIGAVVSGTVSLEDLGRLQVYLVSYVGMSLLLTFWVLPGLVAALTPISYRDIMSRMRDALVMAFMTASLFAVLPLLMEQVKGLVRDRIPEGDAPLDVIVPASFNFPHTGKVLSLSFLLFAGWFADRPVPIADYPQMAGTGLLAMFGSANAAIPFLLDMLRLPADLFRLFVTSGVVNARVGTLLAAVHTITVAVLGMCAVSGALTFDLRKLMRFAAATAFLTAAVVGGTRAALQAAVSGREPGETLAHMRMLRDRGEARVFRSHDQVPPLSATGAVLARIHERGAVRVGYFDDSLPYAFFNQKRELVGFDVEMALQLARDLNITAELVPVDRAVMEAGLDPSVCDLIMSGVSVTVNRAARLQFSASYLDETVAFIVPDHRAAAFTEWSRIRAMTGLRLGVPRAPYYMQKIRDELKRVEIIPIEQMADIFEPHDPPIDAFVATAERGSAYTLLHPAYSVAVPKPRPFKVPLAYVIAGRDPAMVAMVDTWIEQKRKDGTIEDLFAHWILGQNSAPPAPRWSVMRNVLGWSR
jgi:Na+/H+-dicarboxylate symporter/ABC-type amino acid transport substrate-binding protein